MLSGLLALRASSSRGWGRSCCLRLRSRSGDWCCRFCRRCDLRSNVGVNGREGRSLHLHHLGVGSVEVGLREVRKIEVCYINAVRPGSDMI